MFDLRSFDLASLLQCSTTLRGFGDGADSMEEVATDITNYLRDSLRDNERSRPALELVRLYKTHIWDDLDPDVRDRAAAVAGVGTDLSGVPCLTLLGTSGSEPEWNDRRTSAHHQAIPLTSVAAVASSPMVAALISQLGLDTGDVVGADPSLFRPMGNLACGVFYVPAATGSSHVPAQDFVAAHDIASVVGFGGVLPDGHMFAVVMFANITIPASTADEFAALAFSINLALLPFVGRKTFAADVADSLTNPAEWGARLNAARIDALTGLLDARQRVVVEQAAGLAASEAFKTAILDAAKECIITMSNDGRVLEFNRTAQRTFGYSREDALGRPLAELIIPPDQRRAHANGLRRYFRTGIAPILNERVELTAMRADGSEIPVELTVSRAASLDPPVFVGSVRDLTSRRAIEAELAVESGRSAHIAATLQTSLLPRTLPVLPGLDLGAAYQAAGQGYDVGGDFYDVFEIGPDDWGFVLGDVMGKGPEAAVVTALARYTVRAAAIRARKPAAVLAVLNTALHQQHPERSCTAIYGRLRRRPAGIKLTLGSAGHMPALLRRANGTISEIPATGGLLGSFPNWSGVSQTVDLRTDDLVLVYSDGVTDARRGDDMFGTEGLTTALGATTGKPADHTVRAIEAELASFCPEPVDDIAILALRVTP